MFGYHGNVCKIDRLNFFHRPCVDSIQPYLHFDTKNTIPLWLTFGYKLYFTCFGGFEDLVTQPINTLQMRYRGKIFLFLVVITPKKLSHGLVLSILTTCTSLWGIWNNKLTPSLLLFGQKTPPPSFGARNLCRFWCLYARIVAIIYPKCCHGNKNSTKMGLFHDLIQFCFPFLCNLGRFILKTGLIFILIKKFASPYGLSQLSFNVWLVFDRKPHISLGTPRIWGLPLK